MVSYNQERIKITLISDLYTKCKVLGEVSLRDKFASTMDLIGFSGIKLSNLICFDPSFGISLVSYNQERIKITLIFGFFYTKCKVLSEVRLGAKFAFTMGLNGFSGI